MLLKRRNTLQARRTYVVKKAAPSPSDLVEQPFLNMINR
ncbi:hypothetical protein HMPREF9412_0300 [Paenibacillus sp. HGF5]|nr:hypothetical protein HMPREF9412_0300 [Paenibacillus sp. HGF5]